MGGADLKVGAPKMGQKRRKFCIFRPSQVNFEALLGLANSWEGKTPGALWGTPIWGAVGERGGQPNIYQP